jgi:hypothetical protein
MVVVRTPPMTSSELKLYLEQHLNNELQWLLRAASEWHVQHELKLEIKGYSVQVYAMDSAFLHARTLFEFFTKPTGRNYYGSDVFQVATLSSALYTDDWVEILHAYLMHAQDRSSPRQLEGFDGSTTKDLNEMPVDFAKEVVRLWREFIKLLHASTDPDIQALAVPGSDCLQKAIANAAHVLSSAIVKKPVSSIIW